MNKIPRGIPKVEIWTDGACEPNPGVGGFGALLVFAGNDVEISGGEENTTNNRMEMRAAIEALQAIGEPAKVTLHSDSQYLTKGMTEWMGKWKRYGLPEKNRDLWQELVRLADYHEVEWRWVRGHSGVERNEYCDRLAAYGRACVLGTDGNEGFKKWLERGGEGVWIL